MNDHFTMAAVYFGCVAASVFLFRRAPDQPQRIAMLLLIFGFAAMAVTMVAAGVNGRGPDWQDFLRVVRGAGRELMQTGLIVMLLRLVWKEWVCAPVTHPKCEERLTLSRAVAGAVVAMLLAVATDPAIATDAAEVVSLVGVAEKMSVVAVLVVGLYFAWLEIKRGRGHLHDMRNKLVDCHAAREMWKTACVQAKAACDHAGVKLDGFSMPEMLAREERLLSEPKST